MKRTYYRGELYYADLGIGVGSEQNGYRPVVVIQNDVGNKHSPTTIVAAVSTQIKSKAKLPTHFYVSHECGLVQPSIIMLEQIRTIDKTRMDKYIGKLYSLEKDDQIFPLSKSELHRVMTIGSEKAGVKRITIHGLRHSHISLLMNYVSCASVMDIAKRAGHKSPDITMIYSHRYSNKDEIIADQLSDMMKGGRGHVGEEQGPERPLAM